jgi:hypothetical protein
LSGVLASLLEVLRPPRVRIAGGLAATAALVALIIWFPFPEDTGRSGLPKLPPYRFHLQTRDAADALKESDLQAGLEAYERGDFENAIARLAEVERLELDEVGKTLRSIYHGSALAWAGRYDESVAVLNPIPFHLIPSPWGREGQWTLYVALKESKREASADSLLRVLAQVPGTVGERARQRRGGD